tara:strand:+ start:315 stop:647 length:333 start_codon:yes stop_codon:yes gene_type:complete
MKKAIKKEKKDIYQWFSWFNNKWNDFEAFSEFESGFAPEDVAENFVDINKAEIKELFKTFDSEDRDALDQFQKLTECESHVFRILKNQFTSKSNVKFVDFSKKKKGNSEP